MITAVDSNILLDMVVGTAAQMAEARAALNKADRDGIVVICIVAYAEVVNQFSRFAAANNFLSSLHCTVTSIDLRAGHLAGQFFFDYRQRGGGRTRILPDFLIAAHAQLQADRLLTRDQRFFREFPKLKAVSPTDLI